MKITRLDHLVLTVNDMARSIDFYTRVLGLAAITFGEGRQALRCGDQKINLHPAGAEYAPHALRPTPGSADLCLLCAMPLAEIRTILEREGIAIERGPVQRSGAGGAILSLYLRDPDGNLIELSNPLTV